MTHYIESQQHGQTSSVPITLLLDMISISNSCVDYVKNEGRLNGMIENKIKNAFA